MLDTHIDLPTGRRPRPSLDELLTALGLLGKKRLAHLMSRFGAAVPAGPMETATALEENQPLVAKLIRLANNVQSGAGIPVTSAAAATMRLGVDRTQALVIAYEVAKLIEETLGSDSSAGRHFWQTSLARGCTARAIAMHGRRNLAGAAFLVGFLQDIGRPLLAATYPDSVRDTARRSAGCPLSQAMYFYEAQGTNHIHVASRLLADWQTPRPVLEAVSRHCTNPPLGSAADNAMRLWQIGFVVGILPFGQAGLPKLYKPYLERIMMSAFGMSQPVVGRLLAEAREEFEEARGLFVGFDPWPLRATDLFRSSAGLFTNDTSGHEASGQPTVVPPIRDFAGYFSVSSNMV